MNRTLRCISLALCLLLPGACAGGGRLAPDRFADVRGHDAPRSITRFSFTTPDGLEFDAVIETPAVSERNGFGVLMMGGGFGNDLDWTSPGSLSIEGQSMQVTISGEPHSDAPAISAALADRGFVVMRWSTIARGDPLADAWPERATTRPLSDMLEHARAALGSLRASGLIETDRVILLGHSLGAARACTLAAGDEGVRGLILLAPAYFTRPDRTPASFEAAQMRFGEDVVRDRRLPCLALFGALDDSRAVDSAAAAALAGGAGYESLHVSVRPGMGHQLGPQQGAMHGPIDPAIADALGAWAMAVVVSPAQERR